MDLHLATFMRTNLFPTKRGEVPFLPEQGLSYQAQRRSRQTLSPRQNGRPSPPWRRPAAPTEPLAASTSPLFSCHGLGLRLPSRSTADTQSSPFTGLATAEVSEGGAGDNEGHSTGAIMLAGIRASTTASLSRGKAGPVRGHRHLRTVVRTWHGAH